MVLVIKKSESTAAYRRIPIILVDQSDGNTLETGITQSNMNIEVSKAGAAQASGTGVWTEIGDGEYSYQFGTTEVNTFGYLLVRIQKTGCREFKGVAQVVGFNPYQTLPTQSSVNTVPTQTEINVSVWGTLPANIAVQTDINNLNDPTASEINAVIETAHGGGAYTTATGFITQTDINALNDLSTSEVQSIINAEEIQSLINGLNDPTASEINAVITTAHGAGSYTTGGGGSQTDISTSVWVYGTRVLTANTNLNDPTPSAINAVITTAHGAGSYVGAGGQTTVNLLQEIQTDTNTTIPDLINGLNDPTPSEVNAVIETAHGGGAYTTATGFITQTDLNNLNDPTASEINAVITTAHGGGAYTTATGFTTQTDINALNDVSTSQIQSLINSHEDNIQSDLNAMNTKLIRIEGMNGLYLAAEYTYNTSDINTKIEFWHYNSQTNKNTHDKTTGLLNTFQLDVTLTGQLPSVIKMGD